MAESILETNWNFIDIYTHTAGRWKTPPAFHRWMSLALISACIEDRVTLSLIEHAPMKPNMWTFLIGGSGVGKDHAIGFALSFIEPEDPICIHDGKLTIPAMYDTMHDYQRETQRDSAPMLLVSSDLPELLPPGPEAQEFTSRALQLFGGRNRILKDHTRTNGKRQIKNPMLNWWAGCTPRWFPNSINSEVFHGGFAGRALFIWGEADHKYGHFIKPLLPPDYDECRDHLRSRVAAFMQGVEGEMLIGVKARGVLDEWMLNHSRERPQNDIQEAVHHRKPALLLKLSMLLCLADWRPGQPLKLRGVDVANAIPLLSEVERGVRHVGDFIYTNPDTQSLERLKDVLRSRGKMTQSGITRAMQTKGIAEPKKLDAMLDSLIRGGQVMFKRDKIEMKGKDGKPVSRWVKTYTWLGAMGLRKMLKVAARRAPIASDNDDRIIIAPEEIERNANDEGDNDGTTES